MSEKLANLFGYPFALSKRVAYVTGLRPMRHVKVTGSTNADLVEQAREGNVGTAVLVADHQLAGKGRLGRRWDDEPSQSLLVSVRLPLRSVPAPFLVAALGVAAREAASQLTTSTVLIKWPNDLVVDDGVQLKKLGGVLAHFVAEPTPMVVVGVGINMLPIEQQPEATSMAQCGMELQDSPTDRDRLLSILLVELASRLENPVSLFEQWRAHCTTIGKQVRVELLNNRVVCGTAVDLSVEGHLLVRDDAGIEHSISAGDVLHLRRARWLGL